VLGRASQAVQRCNWQRRANWPRSSAPCLRPASSQPGGRAKLTSRTPATQRARLSDNLVSSIAGSAVHFGGTSTEMQPGRTVDRWKLLRRLGGTGTSSVWEAEEDQSGRRVALKLLKSVNYLHLQRFRDEIRLYERLGSRAGIVPLVGYRLPPEKKGGAADGPAWIAMEIATPIADFLGIERDLGDVVAAVSSFAHTLAELANEGIYHRDIKPANLYCFNGEFAIGDFGIADFPDKTGVTTPGRKMGPANYLAPEMIEYCGDVASGPADVYALAKTFWALAVGRNFPPPGELRRDRADLRLSAQIEDARAESLELVLERATAHNPAERPTMSNFEQELSWWSQSGIPPRLDLTEYRSDVALISNAATRRGPTDQEREDALIGDAAHVIGNGIFQPLRSAIESAGLVHHSAAATDNSEWFPPDFGSNASFGSWCVEGLHSPSLVAGAGLRHRLRPQNEPRAQIIFVVIATKDSEGYKGRLSITEAYHLDSLGLDRLVADIWERVRRELPAIVSDYLAACKRAV
jgi:serine/threonine protein kinase